MQTDRQWKLEAVLVLGAGLMISLSFGMLLSLALHRVEPDLSVSQEKFWAFVISGVSFQGAGLALAHFFLKQHELTWAEFLGLKGPNLRRATLLGVVTAALVIPLTLFLNKQAGRLITFFQGTPEIQPTMQVLQLSVSLGQRLCFGAAAILVAPVVEEVLFRGILYRTIKQQGHPMLGLFLSSLLFGAIHANLMTLIPLAFLAAVLALLYDRTNNLMAPILAHSLFNAVNLFIFLLSPP